MDSPDPPPKALTDFMNEDGELERFTSFKNTSARELHPGFSHKSLYDDQRAEFRPLPSTVLSSTLSKAMLQSDLAASLNYKPEGCGWEDVLNCIAIAKSSYDDKGKSNKFRGWSRDANATVDILKSLTGMLPDEEGLSFLRQGLVIIFQAWQTRIKNKEEILRHLDDLPALLSKATEMWKLSTRDQRLKNAVYDTCQIAVTSTNDLIQILLRTQNGSFITRNMHRIPAAESQRIDDISDNLDRAKMALENCMSRILHEQVANVRENTTSTLAQVQAMRHRQMLEGTMLREIRDIVARQSQSRLHDDVTTSGMLKECLREMWASMMETGLYRLGEETEYCQRFVHPQNTDAATSEYGAKITISKEDLLQHLKLATIDSVVEDVESIRQQETNVASEGREVARKIMAMEEFVEWATKDDSRLLLLDGHCKNFGNGKTSPLSVLCASLASTLAEAQSLVILQYYCGHHALEKNGLPGGPLGLIKGLLEQLLSKPDDVLPNALQIEKELGKRAKTDDINSLCEIFGTVFSQVQRNKITICIIDEIAEFEGTSGGWDTDMSSVAFQLRWMVHKYRGPQTLKVLMTSANKSVVVCDLLEENDKISFRGGGLPNHSSRRLVMSGNLPFP